MNRIIIDVGASLLFFAAVAAQGQSLDPKRPPELEKLDVWIGDWTLSGTAKDQPNGPEYSLHWRLHERWTLNGFFLQVDQVWNGNGQILNGLEMLYYDPIKRIYTDSGFGSDGSTWFLTGTFDGPTMIETGETKGPDGAVTRCRMTWVFADQSTSLSGTQQCDKNGVRWKALEVTGTKSKATR